MKEGRQGAFGRATIITISDIKKLDFWKKRYPKAKAYRLRCAARVSLVIVRSVRRSSLEPRRYCPALAAHLHAVGKASTRRTANRDRNCGSAGVQGMQGPIQHQEGPGVLARAMLGPFSFARGRKLSQISCWSCPAGSACPGEIIALSSASRFST